METLGTIVLWLVALALVAVYPFTELARGMASNPDAHERSRGGCVFSCVGLALAVLLLAGCSTPAVREVTVTKQVPVPYAAPCPKPEDKPALPKRVAAEHPTMPSTVEQRERILASKILEWLTYGEAADGIMTACSRLK